MTTTATPALTATSRSHGRSSSRRARAFGWGISGAISAFLLFDAVTHLLNLDVVRQATAQLGFSADKSVVFGVLELGCLALYWLRPTAVLGAVLQTAYLGGALCAQLRIDAPLFSTLLFPVYVAVLVWAGLWLRDERVRALLPVRR